MQEQAVVLYTQHPLLSVLMPINDAPDYKQCKTLSLMAMPHASLEWRLLVRNKHATCEVIDGSRLES